MLGNIRYPEFVGIAARPMSLHHDWRRNLSMVGKRFFQSRRMITLKNSDFSLNLFIVNGS